MISHVIQPLHIQMTKCTLGTEIMPAHRSGDAAKPASCQVGAMGQEASGVAPAGTGGMARCGSAQGGTSLSDTSRAAVRHAPGDARTQRISLVADIDVRRSSPRVPRPLSVPNPRQIDNAQIPLAEETGEVHSAPLDARNAESGRG